MELTFIDPQYIALSSYTIKTIDIGWVKKVVIHAPEHEWLKSQYPNAKIKMKTLCVYFNDNVPVYIHRLNSNSEQYIEHLIEVKPYMLDIYNTYIMNCIKNKESLDKRKKQGKRRYRYNLYNLMQKKMLAF